MIYRKIIVYNKTVILPDKKQAKLLKPNVAGINSSLKAVRNIDRNIRTEYNNRDTKMKTKFNN